MDLKEWRLIPASGGRRHPWEIARTRIVTTLVRKHLASDLTTPFILDFGCGDLFVTQALKKEYAQAHLVAIDAAFEDPEVHSKFASMAEKNSISMYESIATAEQKVTKPSGKKADFCLTLDVLEHCEDDVATLRLLLNSPLLDQRSRTLITVPAHQFLISSHDKALGHRRRYSRKQLLATIERSGGTTLESGYMFSSLLPLRGFQVIAEQLRGPSLKREFCGLAGYRGSLLLSWALSTALIADFKFTELLRRARIQLPGLSCYAICRKS